MVRGCCHLQIDFAIAATAETGLVLQSDYCALQQLLSEADIYFFMPLYSKPMRNYDFKVCLVNAPHSGARRCMSQ